MSPIKRIAVKGKSYHEQYLSSGAYRFVLLNGVRLLFFIAVLGLAAVLFNTYVFNIADAADYMIAHFSVPVVLAIFQLSEMSHGLVPPEVLMTWISGFDNPWLWLFLLASISYVGGLCGYLIGRRLDRLPKVHEWVFGKFEQQFKHIKQFGGLLIVVAAITPLPYSPICIISGTVKFPLRKFLLVTTSRYVRFMVYGYLIFFALN